MMNRQQEEAAPPSWCTENGGPRDDGISCADAAFRTFGAETPCVNDSRGGDEENRNGWLGTTRDGQAPVLRRR